MRRISLFIVDDEPWASALLKGYLKDVTWVEVLGEADDVVSGFNGIVSMEPDVILLDIHLSGESGFDLLEKLIEQQIRVKVIFVSAYDNYAVRAIRSSAFDYLLKPVKKIELLESLEKVSKMVQAGTIGERSSQLFYQLSEKKKIKFSIPAGFIMIQPDEILYCRADLKHTILELDGGKSITVTKNLGKVEELLPGFCFSRISRSVIINLHYLTAVSRKSLTCEITNQTTHVLRVSKKYMEVLEERCDKHFSIHEKGKF